MPVGRGERFFTSLRLRLNLWAFGRCFDSAQHDPLVLHTCGIVSFIFPIRLPGKTTFLHLSSLNASRSTGMPVGRGERFFTSLRLLLNLWAFGRCFDSAQHDSLVLHPCVIVSFIFPIRLPGKTTSLHLSSLNVSRPNGMPVGRGERFFTSLRLLLILWAFGRCFDSAWFLYYSEGDKYARIYFPHREDSRCEQVWLGQRYGFILGPDRAFLHYIFFYFDPN